MAGGRRGAGVRVRVVVLELGEEPRDERRLKVAPDQIRELRRDLLCRQQGAQAGSLVGALGGGWTDGARARAPRWTPLTCGLLVPEHDEAVLTVAAGEAGQRGSYTSRWRSREGFSRHDVVVLRTPSVVRELLLDRGLAAENGQRQVSTSGTSRASGPGAPGPWGTTVRSLACTCSR